MSSKKITKSQILGMRNKLEVVLEDARLSVCKKYVVQAIGLLDDLREEARPE